MNKSINIYKSRINRAIDYINSNLNKTISLDELASVSFFSPYHFHRIFVAITGETVKNFTSRTRLEKAARLLKFSKKPIIDVAFECGFSSSSTFSRAFKKYFEVSPSVYRKSREIKNSKICNELFQITQYHCQMNEDELKNNFPVEIRELPKRRIAYKRVVDAYKEGVVLGAFENVLEWAKEANLFNSEQIFGMSIDDPMVTPKEKYRYEACITIPENFVIDANNLMETITLPQSKYAVSTVSGDLRQVATATNYLFNVWLINSSYEPEHTPCLEIFLDKKNICNWNYFHLDICIPVKKIKAI